MFTSVLLQIDIENISYNHLEYDEAIAEVWEKNWLEKMFHSQTMMSLGKIIRRGKWSSNDCVWIKLELD